jgi:Transposase
MLLDHLDGILNYCRTKVRFGVVEAINGNIKTLLRRGRGYKNLAYLLLKARRMAFTKTEFIVVRKAALHACLYKFLRRALFLVSPGRDSAHPRGPTLSAFPPFSQLSFTEKISPSQRMTARSITFCSSRTFPGQP